MANPSNNPAPHAGERESPAAPRDGVTPGMAAAPRAEPSLVEGQLGPDELPDPEEVVQNTEAKLRNTPMPEAAATEAPTHELEDRAMDAADEAGSALLEHDKVLSQRQER